jgi:hypothetical protein
MEAFIERYCGHWPAPLLQQYSDWMRFWNGASPQVPCWDEWVEAGPAMTAGARQWAENLAQQPDLVTQLVKFAAKMLK